MDFPVVEVALAATAELSKTLPKTLTAIKTAAEVAAQAAMGKMAWSLSGEPEEAQYPEAISTLAAEPAA